jgi:hypothetical protein
LRTEVVCSIVPRDSIDARKESCFAARCRRYFEPPGDADGERPRARILGVYCSSPPPVRDGPRVIQLEEIALPCPEPSTEEPHHVTPAVDAVMPEAVGVWMARCQPGHQAFIRQEFTYDGRYVTIVYAPINTFITDPRIYLPSADNTYRLESRWEGQTLWVRLPPGNWEEFAHFNEGRFW